MCNCFTSTPAIGATSGLLMNSQSIAGCGTFNIDISECNIGRAASVERKVFQTCLSMRFYKKLQGDMINYSSAVAWNNQQQYTAGDSVIYNELIYTAVQDNSGQKPFSNTLYWNVAKKFNKDCYNEFWCMFLCNYIKDALTIDTIEVSGGIKFTANGANRIKETENSVPLKADELLKYITTLKNKLNEDFLSMEFWARNNNTDNCFDDLLAVTSDCCDACNFLTIDCTCSNSNLNQKLINRQRIKGYGAKNDTDRLLAEFN